VVINRISRKFKVSPIVIARRLFEFSKITSDVYWNWYDAYQEEWHILKEKLKANKKDSPSYGIRIRTKLGKALINTVIDAAREGKISELDASLILNVKTNYFPKIL
jgi:Zn-dependent peptidase ImmA (M78 family)